MLGQKFNEIQSYMYQSVATATHYKGLMTDSYVATEIDW